MSNSMYVIKQDKLQELSHKDIVRFALFCAYQVKNKWGKITGKANYEVIKQVELWLEDKVTGDDCRQIATKLEADIIVQYVAWTTSYNHVAGYSHVNAPAYYASRASVIAISNLLNDKVINEQVKYYNELRYVDDIFETIVLEDK
jgi:hypothetical protein